MLDKKLMVMVNSDDPAYFGGYLNKNLTETQAALNLSYEQVKTLLVNSFKSSLLNDTEKKKFKGTGGGTYTTLDGKYSEKIEFFSRDISRVGMSLEFNFGIENGDWIHQGKTSKGAPLHEIWTKRKK